MAASIRMVLATAAVAKIELRHLNTEQASIKANVDEEIYIEIPEDYQGSGWKIEQSNLRTGPSRALLERQDHERRKNIVLEQSHGDPCVLGKIMDEKLELVVTLHVNDIPVATRQTKPSTDYSLK